MTANFKVQVQNPESVIKTGYSGQLGLCSAWLSLILSFIFFIFFFGGGSGNPNFFLCLSSSLVNPRLHTENQLCIMP